MASRAAWRARQRRMNSATKALGIKGYKPLIVDGVPGPATRMRINHLKWFLGYYHKERRTTAYTVEFDGQLKWLWSRHHRSVKMIHRGKARVAKHNRAYVADQNKGHATSGITTFDGVTVFAGAVRYLSWARSHGWQGHLNSGYRTPAYSESLCYRMCGAPTCSGRCAGRSTNHAYAQPDRFAIDVSDYVTFGRLMQSCPYSPRLHNYLGARDPVHFSPSGR